MNIFWVFPVLCSDVLEEAFVLPFSRYEDGWQSVTVGNSQRFIRLDGIEWDGIRTDGRDGWMSLTSQADLFHHLPILFPPCSLCGMVLVAL